MNQAQPNSHPSIITSDNFELAVLQSPSPVLLDFWASWCVPCKLMKRTVEKAAEALGGDVKVGLVNIDAEPELVARFGIQGIPAFVVIADGEVVTTFTGMSTSGKIVNHVRNAILSKSA